MKRLKRIGLFTYTDKLDRFSGNRFHRKRRTAACITVEFRQYNAVDFEQPIKVFGNVHRVLPCHGIDHKKDLVGFKSLLEIFDFSHEARRQRGVDQRCQQSPHHCHLPHVRNACSGNADDVF